MRLRHRAEYISFIIAFIVISTVAVLVLIRQFRHGVEDVLVVHVEAEWRELKEKEGSFTLPVLIRNKGGRTATDLKLRIRNGSESFYHEVKYLSPRSPKTIYLLFRKKPVPEEVSLEPLLYSFD